VTAVGTPSRVRWIVAGAFGLMAAVTGLGWQVAPAGAATPTVAVTPSAPAGQYRNGQTVTVSVGPNSMFVPNTRVVILECADPAGTAADLPTSLSNCDENTIQGDTVSVHANGSFSETAYTVYALPNSALGEQATWQPVCNATQQCVLFVGEDQNDFTQPKVFSQAFTVSGTGITAPTGDAPTPAAGMSGTSGQASGTSASSGSGSSGTSGAANDPGVSTSAAETGAAGTLAFTGTPDWLLPAAVLGLLLTLMGGAGLVLSRRYGQ